MPKKIKKNTVSALTTDKCASFIKSALPHLLGSLILLVSISFFTATFDSAHVKLTLFQIGAIMLLTLWGALKVTQRTNPFPRQTWPFLAPLFIYLLWQSISFLFFPYKLAAAEEFTRLLMYGGISALVACEFTPRDIRTLTKYLLLAAWISFIYGFVQVLAIRWPNVDFLPWHHFFVGRTFSTHTNPNFFGAFIVFASAIIATEFLRTKQKRLLVLLGIGLVDLYFTESKGAWLAFGAMAVFFAFTYTRYFTPLKKHRLTVNVIAIACLIIALIGTGIYSVKRVQSVSFRAYTWLSTIEMAKDSPILGTGPGSFKIVYPAYRRPQIFYIENMHNNETQHAENEYLEQLATGGVIGLALFLWLFTFLFACAFKNLKSPLPEKSLPPNYYLLGYTAALAGLLIHAFVDISIHFVSSGLLLAVFIGVILSFAIQPSQPQVVTMSSNNYPRILLAIRIFTILAIGSLLVYISVEFAHILRALALVSLGEKILFALALLAFVGCIVAAGYVYIRVVVQTRRIFVCGLLLLSLPLCWHSFNVFTANHYYSLGVALVNLHQPHAALPAFTDAIKRNPFLDEYHQFRGNLFATTLDLSKRFNISLGDSTLPRTDFERAMADFNFVKKHNPNHSLLAQEIGQLHYALALRQLNQAQETPAQALLYRQLAMENFAMAKKSFLDALKLDPVNVNTYILLINMALFRNDVVEAQNWVDTYKSGPKGVREEEFLARHQNNPQIQTLQDQINRLKAALSL